MVSTVLTVNDPINCGRPQSYALGMDETQLKIGVAVFLGTLVTLTFMFSGCTRQVQASATEPPPNLPMKCERVALIDNKGGIGGIGVEAVFRCTGFGETCYAYRGWDRGGISCFKDQS